MANADDLSRLAEEVKSAYEERVKCITDIKKETVGLLRGFDKAHNEMAEELRAKLATDEKTRKTETQAEITERGVYIEKLLEDFDEAHTEMADNLRAELARVKPDLKSAESERKKSDRAEITERGVYIEKLLEDFDKAHNEMAEELRAKLATDEKTRKTETQAEIVERGVYIEKLLEDFDETHKEMADNLRAELARVKPDLESAESERKKSDRAEITERGVYIEKLLEDFDEAHKEMAEELRAKLSTDEKTRKTETQAEIKEREGYIENLLADFDKAHQEMADDLRAELSRVKPDLESAESERKTSGQAEVMERKEAVRSMLDEFRKEQEETAAAWQKLLATMQSARGPAVKAAVEVKSVEEVIEEPAEEAAEEAEEETIEDREELKENIIEVLEDNPDGKKMTEIAEILGIENWRSLISVMRELLDAGEIRKENSTYYVA